MNSNELLAINFILVIRAYDFLHIYINHNFEAESSSLSQSLLWECPMANLDKIWLGSLFAMGLAARNGTQSI